MLNRLLTILAALLLLAGLCFCFYPSYRTADIQRQGSTQISEFVEYRTEHLMEDIKTEIPFRELWDASVEYNCRLLTDGQELSADQFRTAPFDPASVGWTAEPFGFITIPAADIDFPIYFGATDANIKKGAALLGQTSIPTGGLGTHTVICGHRTWHGAVMFQDLEKLEPGDLVNITNPWTTLNYRVISKQIISPNDTEHLLLRPSRDLLSVFTCSRPNSLRLFITCERIIGETP